MAGPNITIKYFPQKHMYGFVASTGKLPDKMDGMYTTIDHAERALQEYVDNNGSKVQKATKSV